MVASVGTVRDEPVLIEISEIDADLFVERRRDVDGVAHPL